MDEPRIQLNSKSKSDSFINDGKLADGSLKLSHNSWKLIDKYFIENPTSLVDHHLESYNDFMNNGIQRIFTENNPIRIIENEGEDVNSETRNECLVYLGGKDGTKIYYGKPVIYNEQRTQYMYPNSARLQNMTYGTSIQYEVDIEFIYYDVNSERRVFETTLPKMMTLGRFPIMINSQLCILHGLTREAKFGLGECKNDNGGYFIIDGKEKVIMSQEKFANNMIYIQKHAIDDTYSYTANIRSVSEDSSKQIRTTAIGIVSGGTHDDSHQLGVPQGQDSNNPADVKRTGNPTTKAFTYNNIVVIVPNVRTPVPLFILMRALGIISDKDIINTCLLGFEGNDDLVDLFRPSVHDASPVFTQRAALEYIKTFTKINSISGVLEILSDYFLPHVGETNFIEKAYFVGMMVKKMLLTSAGYTLPTDRDNFKYKRVETSGNLLYDLFREYFLIEKKNITQKIGIEYNNNIGIYTDTIVRGSDLSEDDMGDHMFYKLITPESNLIEFFKDKLLEQGITKAFKGNWGSQSYTKRLGIVQGLDRLSWYSHLHALRKLILPLDSSAKVVGPRRLHSSQWGIIDPIDTPDGGHIGLHKQMTICAHITSGYPVSKMIDWIFKNMDIYVQPIGDFSPEYLGKISKILVNGQWIGSTSMPTSVVTKMKIYRRNGIIPVFTSISMDYKTADVIIYTDAGRLSRPIYYLNSDKTNYHKNIEELFDTDQITWEQIVTGTRSKSLESFSHKQNKVFSPHQLYPELVEENDKKNDSEEREDKNDKYLFRELNKTASMIDYMDSSEAESPLIAMLPDDLTNTETSHLPYTHLEIDPSLILGMLSNQTIYPEHNPVARNVFSCGQAKQAVSLYHSNFQSRMDKMGVILNYGQTPLVKSKYMKYVNNEEHPNGVNTIVAIMAYTGYNVEDAILVNKGALDRGLFRTTYMTSYETKEESEVISGGSRSKFANIEQTPNVSKLKKEYDYSFLDERGIIHEGTQVTDKTILAGKISNGGDNDTWADDSLKTKRGQLGVVDKTFLTESEEGFNLAKVRIRHDRIPQIGDKMVSRAGQKGTIGLVIEEEDMPFTADGIRPDLIINPHAVPSRMTIGQLIESVLGTVGSTVGAFGNSTVFQNKGSKLDMYGQIMNQYGFQSEGLQLLYNGENGEQLKSNIFIGPTYYMRLKHMVKDKVNYRARGKRDILTRQTNQGRADEGGLRVGEMERDGILGHGITKFLTDSFINRGDEFFMGICNTTGTIAVYNKALDLFYSPFADGPVNFHVNPDSSMKLNNVTKYGRSFSLVRVPYAFKLLIQELQIMNVQLRIVTEDNINHLSTMKGSTNIQKLLGLGEGLDPNIESSVISDQSMMDEKYDEIVESNMDKYNKTKSTDEVLKHITDIIHNLDLPEQIDEPIDDGIDKDIQSDINPSNLVEKYNLDDYALSYTDKIQCLKKTNIIPALTDPNEFYALASVILPNKYHDESKSDNNSNSNTRPSELDLPIYTDLTNDDVINTFDYLFYHIRIGIFVQIKDGKLSQFIPFQNLEYTNTWHTNKNILRFSDGKGGEVSMDEYYTKKKKQKYNHATVQADVKNWSSNNCLLGTWSDNEIGNMGWFEVREMIHKTCEERTVKDCVFFVNRRDHPVLTPNGMEPYFHMFDGLTTPLPDKHRHLKYVPILSFCKNDDFADLLIPNYGDWRNITKRLYPSNCDSMEIDDITHDWSKKKPMAVFRGSATGCGNTPEDNQRIRLAVLSKKLEESKNPEHHTLMDAGLVGKPTRDKKVMGKAIDFFRYKKYKKIMEKPRMSMNNQSEYKYIIHVDGHVSAYRLGKELSLGSTILKVDSQYDYKLWFDSFLKEGTHYLSVNKNLDNMATVIRDCKRNDDKCKKIAENALELHSQIMNVDFITDYMANMINSISDNFKE
jgi:DNA-directed RNA polymerase II subunit RPB2